MLRLKVSQESQNSCDCIFLALHRQHHLVVPQLLVEPDPALPCRVEAHHSLRQVEPAELLCQFLHAHQRRPQNKQVVLHGQRGSRVLQQGLQTHHRLLVDDLGLHKRNALLLALVERCLVAVVEHSEHVGPALVPPLVDGQLVANLRDWSPDYFEVDVAIQTRHTLNVLCEAERAIAVLGFV